MRQRLLLMLFLFTTLFAVGIHAANSINSVDSANTGSSSGLPSSLLQLSDAIRPIIIRFSFLIGGLFGLYFILIILRVHYDRQILNTLRHIQYDLDHHNHYLGIPTSHDRKGFWGQLWHSLRILFSHHPPAQHPRPASRVRKRR